MDGQENSSQPVSNGLSDANNPAPLAGAEPQVATQPQWGEQPYSAQTTQSSNFAFQVPRDSSMSSTQYLIMYVIGFFLIASILSSVSTLISLFFGNFDTKSENIYSSYLSGFKLYLMLWSISNLIVVTPVYVFLVLRLRSFQPNTLTEFGNKVKNFAYGIFMVLLGLSALASLVATVYQVSLKFVPKSSLLGEAASVWWTGFASALATTILLVATFAFYLIKNSKKAE